MHLFDAKDVLQKYEKVTDIIDAYYEVRLNLYSSRKDFMIRALERDLVVLSNKAKYIQENLDGTIDLRKKKREEVQTMLTEKGYDKIDDDEDYRYLVKMPMDSVTEENVEKLLKEKGTKEAVLEQVKKTSVQEMWSGELDRLTEQYLEYKTERVRMMNGEDSKKKSVVKKSGLVKKTVV